MVVKRDTGAGGKEEKEEEEMLLVFPSTVSRARRIQRDPITESGRVPSAKRPEEDIPEEATPDDSVVRRGR